MPAELNFFEKLTLVLSNGQTSAEGGFNTNKTLLKVNKNEKSLVSGRLIIRHMQQNRSLLSTIEITIKLIRSVKAAR